jgi:hypothetical protein
MEQVPKADLKFILFHRQTGTEIEMPVLSICQEHSHIAFSTKMGAYEDKYNGIGRLPNWEKETDDPKNYDLFIVINGTKCLYDGLFWCVNNEIKR